MGKRSSLLVQQDFDEDLDHPKVSLTEGHLVAGAKELVQVCADPSAPATMDRELRAFTWAARTGASVSLSPCFRNRP